MNAKTSKRCCCECAEPIEVARVAAIPTVLNCATCEELWVRQQHAPRRARVQPFSYTHLPRRDYMPRRMA